MDRMFDSYYEFDRDDHYFRISDIAATTENRDHKHSDVEQGMAAYSANWECLASSTTRRRGSDKLYLVDDAYYVWCSRTGMEDVGNTLYISSNAPDNLVFALVSSVFEEVASRNFGEIKHGVEKETLVSDGELTICSPRAVVLASELTEAELEEYYDALADLVVQMIDKYHGVETVDDIMGVVEWYREEQKSLFRDFIGFEPTVVSQAINSGQVEYKNGWRGPDEVDAGKSCVLIMHEEFDSREYMIEVGQHFKEDYTVDVIVQEGQNEECVITREYESWQELVAILDELMTETPDTLDGRCDC